MYYTQAGGVDLLKAKWKKLSEFVSVECDGEYIFTIVIITNTAAMLSQVWTSRPSCANTRSTPFSSSTCRASALGRGPGIPRTARSGWTTVSVSPHVPETPHLTSPHLPCARPDRGGGADHLPAAAAAGGGHGPLHHPVQGRELKPHMAEEAIHIHSTYCNTGSLDGRGEI